MCGIIGHVFRRPGVREPLSGRLLSRISHRGPDGTGVFTDAHVQLGHTRLSIIDLSEAGSQPMVIADGRYVVTYNGEIYNYIELRAELEAMGERFTSSSDTEVLLAAFKVWGSDCVRHFRGMFAFALWDKEKRTMFLARDRCGEKPFFYYRDRDRFIFASELKALLPMLGHTPKLDAGAVDMYLHYQYVPEPFTLLRGVEKLPAAHTLMLSLEKWDAEPLRYWNIEDVVATDAVPSDGPEIMAAIRDALEDAVRVTLRADVPVGIALSGGIDSGTIAAFAQKFYRQPMHAFCVGYPGRPPYDERAQARALAEQLGMTVHEVELPVETFVSFFVDLVRIMDEPIGDPAAFGHYSVPKAASDAGIKVLLSGIGGDELFWGYDWVRHAVNINETLASKPALRNLAQRIGSPGTHFLLGKVAQSARTPAQMRSWAGTLNKLCDPHTPANQLRFYAREPQFSDAYRFKASIYGDTMRSIAPDNEFRATNIGPREGNTISAAVLRLLFDTWLTSNCLTLGDRVSMAVGVESRMPFLDVNLIERVMALRAFTPDHKLGQKSWLRVALKGVLPDEVLGRPKAGFQPPVHEWLSGVIERYGENVRNGKLVAAGMFDGPRVARALDTLPHEGWPGLFFAYKVVLLEMWHRSVVAS